MKDLFPVFWLDRDFFSWFDLAKGSRVKNLYLSTVSKTITDKAINVIARCQFYYFDFRACTSTWLNKSPALSLFITL